MEVCMGLKLIAAVIVMEVCMDLKPTAAGNVHVP